MVYLNYWKVPNTRQTKSVGCQTKSVVCQTKPVVCQTKPVVWETKITAPGAPSQLQTSEGGQATGVHA